MYVVGVNSTPEPTLSDVLAAINALATKVDRVETTAGRIEADAGQMRTEMNIRFDQVADKVDRVQADVAQVRADVLAVKVEHGFYERHQVSLQAALDRHMQDPGGHSHAA